MKKPILDHYSWTCAYAIYHPVFYSCIKTNFTPSHVHSWPIKKIYNLKSYSPSLKFLPYTREKGDLQAYNCANLFPNAETLSEKARKILLKRFAKRNDINSISKVLSSLSDEQVQSDEYYIIAKCILKEGSVEELLNLIEKGSESLKPPKVSLLGKIFEKAAKEKHYKACDRIWEYILAIERDFRVEKCVLLKLTLVKNDQELLLVYRKAKEWNVLTPRVKKGVLSAAHRISSRFMRDYEYIQRRKGSRSKQLAEMIQG